MFLTQAFCDAVRADFEEQWKPLLDFINDNAYGTAAHPYRLKGSMVANMHGDVELRLLLERTAVGQRDGWRQVAHKGFINTNDAAKYGWMGALYRVFYGRSKSFNEVSGPATLKLKSIGLARDGISHWVRHEIKKDQDSRPQLRLIVNN